MFVLSENTHQNAPNKFLLWAFRFFEYLVVPVWVWGSPCSYAARCENLAHDLRNLWVRNQALPGIRNEIRKSKTWTNTKKIHGSRRPKVQRHELNYLLTFSKDYENMMATMA